MKIKQFFTSFLACMALWSAPVYADTESDVYTKYHNLNNFAEDGFRRVVSAIGASGNIHPLVELGFLDPSHLKKLWYSSVDQLMNPSVEQLKDDMDKKKDILKKAKDYQKALKEFNDQYQKYLNELKLLIDKADDKKKIAARNKARNKMKDLIYSGLGFYGPEYKADAFQNAVGITKNFVEGISKKIRKSKIKNDVTKMKNRYNTEITKAKSKIVTYVNKTETIIKEIQADYDAAVAAYDAASKAGS